MSHVFEVTFYQHHPWLLAIALLIATAGMTGMVLLIRRASALPVARQPLWLAVAGLTGGAGVWTTHFVAMLGYRTQVAPQYEPVLTISSLGLSILSSLIAVILVVQAKGPATTLAGAIFGAGIAAMHFLGMSAVDWVVPATMNEALKITAIIGGIVLSMAGFWFAMDRRRQAIGAATGLLVLAIGSLHFTAMAAMDLERRPGLEPNLGAPPRWLSIEIAFIGMLVLLFGLAMIAVDRRDQRRQAAEEGRIRNFADLAIEGLAIVDGDQIVAVNQSLCRLLDRSEPTMVGKRIETVIPKACLRQLEEQDEGQSVECDVMDALGNNIAVELAVRSTDYCGTPHRVLAVRDLRSRKAAEEKIRFLAYNDPLTGLANRDSFGSQLEQALSRSGRSGHPVAVLALDLDEFKGVNDTLGHGVGDRVLQLVGERIRSATRSEDLIARLGGDEFAILQSSSKQPEAAEMLARRLVDLLGRPMIIEGTIVQVGTSIGIALAEDAILDGPSLQKSADLALYRAKDKGRGTFVFFEPHMDAVMRERRAIENDLRLAMARGSFKLAYQPLYRASDSRLTGFEALLRWSHPTRGQISPAAFIPLAEQTGLIVQIGKWVLRQACHDASGWPEHLTVAVNLSPTQFSNRKIVGAISDALARSGLAPHRLEIEITENVLLQNTTTVIKSLTEIRSLGVRIAMDDFGTGYSSLSYLRSFPFDRVKIDRSFVNNMENDKDSAAIVRAIIGLGQSLGMSTTAEGIENSEQLHRVRSEGCDNLQGFYLSRPVDAEKIGAILEQDQQRDAS